MWEKSFQATLDAIPNCDSDSDGNSDSDSSDAGRGVAAAAGGREAAAAAAAPAARTHLTRDGVRSSATAAERSLSRALAKDPWGRWGGREGKLGRVAAAEAAAAAAAAAKAAAKAAPQPTLGPSQPKVGSASALPRKRARTEPQSVVVTECAEQAALASAARAGAAAAAAAAAAAVAHQPRTPPGWWSCVFVRSAATLGATPLPAVASGGAVAAVAAVAGAAAAPHFTGTEAEQAALCAAMEASKATGRRGLGRVKGGTAAGGEALPAWAGTRVAFSDDGDDAPPQPAQLAGPSTAQAPLHAAVAAAPAALPPTKEVKWKKLASRQLAAAPCNALSEKKLRKRCVAAAAAAAGGSTRSQLEAGFDAAVLRSRRFARDAGGKVIACA